MSNRQIEVLLVEDNPGDARLVRESLAEVRSHDLQREREALLREAGRHRDRGDADEVRGGGEDITQIHR